MFVPLAEFDMRVLSLLLIYANVAQIVAADDPPSVPKTWVKVIVDDRLGSFIAIRAEYAIWFNCVIVAGTEMNRARSYAQTPC
jgi:hypothetical protein